MPQRLTRVARLAFRLTRQNIRSKNMKLNKTIAAAALAGLFVGSAVSASAASTSGSSEAGYANSTSSKTGQSASAFGKTSTVVMGTLAKHDCKGKNECKGKGGCKSGDNGCKGKNSCKGKGGCKTDGSKG